MEVPKQVEAAAQELIEQFGGYVDYLGNKADAEYYVLALPDDITIGFPHVYQYANGQVMTIGGFEALDIIRLFVKDVDEVDVE